LYRRGRSGTSTILGTLIFIGIMFTAVIPMILVMRQADIFYETEKFEGGRLDEEHSREDIDFYAYTELEHSVDICVRIENRGDAPVKIVRLWINDVEKFQDGHPQGENIKSMETMNLYNLTVDLQNLTSYTVKVVTEKGNVFSSKAGTLHYYSASGWYTPSLGICVHIANTNGKYQINATIAIGADEFYHYEFKNVEHDDLEVMIWVEVPGSYYLTIKQWDEGDWLLDVVPAYNDFEVKVEYPATKPITDVYVSGKFV